MKIASKASKSNINYLLTLSREVHFPTVSKSFSSAFVFIVQYVHVGPLITTALFYISNRNFFCSKWWLAGARQSSQEKGKAVVKSVGR